MVEEIYYTDVKQFNQAVLQKYNVDFSGMASTSFRRRMVKAMNINNVNSVANLIEGITKDETFFKQFCSDLIVDTTEFFRDPSFWRKMKEDVFSRYTSALNIRILLVGCGSGEELFSLAIALKEMNLLDKAKITATEVNELSFSKAKAGRFSLKSLEIGESNYERFEGKYKLENYYKASDGFAYFDKALISNVNFKSYFLGKGEIGASFDIIFCRNVLMYTGNSLQDEVVNQVTKSLFKGGFLTVGIKEDISSCSSFSDYITVSNEERIYSKK